MTKFRLVVAAATSFAAITLVSSAHAGGFLADLGQAVGILTPGQAQALDDLHTGLGNPLDDLNPFRPIGSPAVGGGIAAPVAPGGGGRTFQPAPQMSLGNFCYTPAGRFGPGPVQPVGSWCWAATPFGPVDGRVGF